MHAADLPLPTHRIAPRNRVLLGLGAAVLLAHLGLLSGGLSGLSLDLFVAPDAAASADQTTTAAPPPTDTAAATLPPETPEPARSSRVRWIVAKAPEPEPAPPPPAVVKPPPPPLPEPVVVLVPPPPPIEEPAPAPVTETPAPPAPSEVVVAAPAEPVAEPPTTAPSAPASDLQAGTGTEGGTLQGAGLGASDASLPPATPPPNVVLRYQATASVKGVNYNGTGQLDWTHDGQQYEAKLAVRILLFTVLEWHSAGRTTDKGLAPDRFGAKWRGKERAAHFDREGQRIRYSNNAPDAALLPGAQDRFSVSMQLAGLFNARPDAYAQGQMLRLPVTSVDSAEVWLFQVGPLATESLPAGEAPALKLTRSPRKEFDRKVEVWLLPQYAHVPGHIRFTEPNGDITDLKLLDFPALDLKKSDPP